MDAMEQLDEHDENEDDELHQHFEVGGKPQTRFGGENAPGHE